MAAHRLRPGILLLRSQPVPPGGRAFPGGWVLAPDDGRPTTDGGARRLAGLIESDQRWSGVVHLVGDVIIPPGVTVEVAPGTLVLLAHHRRVAGTLGAAPFDEPGALDVRGGQLVVRGTADLPVWFTSDAPEPRPGDWRYLQLRDACPQHESRLTGAIVEFAKLGVLCWNAGPRLRDLFVRHCTWEGLYAEARAAPRLAGVVSRDNGYNGMALEQFNDARLRDCELLGNGTHGLHCDLSRVHAERCRFADNHTHGVSADNRARVTLRRVRVEDNATHGVGLDSGRPWVRVEDSHLTGNGSAGINCRAHTDLLARGNAIVRNRPIQFHCHMPLGDLELSHNWWGSPDRPILERDITGEGPPGSCGAFFWPDWGTVLDAPPPLPPATPRVSAARALERLARASYDPPYRPSERERDPVEYVAADDATRAIARRIGAGLGLPWSVTHDGQALWTATLDTDLLVRLDPTTGAELARFPTPGPQSWGMTWDGEAIWLNDFADLRVYRLDPADGRVTGGFAIPDRAGGAKGLTWTGTHLALLGWRTHAIWLLDRDGAVVDRRPCPLLKGGLTYDLTRHCFWGPCREFILAIDADDGRVRGAITAASDGTWDVEHVGEHLWACQRTNENWDDPKLFALQILDDRRIDLDRFNRRLETFARLGLR